MPLSLGLFPFSPRTAPLIDGLLPLSPTGYFPSHRWIIANLTRVTAPLTDGLLPVSLGLLPL